MTNGGLGRAVGAGVREQTQDSKGHQHILGSFRRSRLQDDLDFTFWSRRFYLFCCRCYQNWEEGRALELQVLVSGEAGSCRVLWTGLPNRPGWPGTGVDSAASACGGLRLWVCTWVPASPTRVLSGFFTSVQVNRGPREWYRILFLASFLEIRLKNDAVRCRAHLAPWEVAESVQSLG